MVVNIFFKGNLEYSGENIRGVQNGAVRVLLRLHTTSREILSARTGYEGVYGIKSSTGLRIWTFRFDLHYLLVSTC